MFLYLFKYLFMFCCVLQCFGLLIVLYNFGVGTVRFGAITIYKKKKIKKITKNKKNDLKEFHPHCRYDNYK